MGGGGLRAAISQGKLVGSGGGGGGGGGEAAFTPLLR